MRIACTNCGRMANAPVCGVCNSRARLAETKKSPWSRIGKSLAYVARKPKTN
jgi:hypothetical protein